MNEPKLWEGRPVLAAHLPSAMLVFVLLGVVPFFFDSYLGLMSLILYCVLYIPVWCLVALAARFAGKYEVDQRKVVIRSGLFFRKCSEIERTHIRASQVTQDFWGQRLGYGNLHLKLEGTDGIEAVLKNIRSPSRIQDLISEKPSGVKDS